MLDFRDHRRELALPEGGLGTNRYVYAVVSRRAGGLSIGVNVNPDKVCNFDCPYCQVDRTVPGSFEGVDVGRLAAELDTLLARVGSGTLWRLPPFDTVAPSLRRVADIAFSGDGEPTAAAEFPQAARQARELRDRRGLPVPMRLLTNATLLNRSLVRSALALFDEIWCKLDAGTEGYFRLVAGTHVPFERVLENLTAVARERPVVVQSLFFTFAGAGPRDDEIAAYVARLAGILGSGGRIDRVQVYTVARRPADPRVGPLGREALEAIAGRVRDLGVAAEVHG
ncbi:MAG: radical SAM protein [Acidobacteria bacterium]|nr:radical SAM protein [Acidobacteriota bacterium]